VAGLLFTLANRPESKTGSAIVARPTAPEAGATGTLPTAEPTEVAAAPPTMTPPATVSPFDASAVRQGLFEGINQARRDAGLPELIIDDIAARAAQAHAEDMSAFGYLSHRNPIGQGPDHRYAELGGQSGVEEIISAPPFSVTQQATDGVVAAFIESLSQQGALDSVVLNQYVTQFGIGIGYNTTVGVARVVLLLTSNEVRLSVPNVASAGSRVAIRGTLSDPEAATQNPELELWYEPTPQGLPLAELQDATPYQSSARIITTLPLRLTGESFSSEVTLPADLTSGIYHLKVFLTPDEGTRYAATDFLLQVQ
jgi:uncharacterized protein YkwD